MQEIYDWNANKIHYETKDGLVIDFQLRDRITVISGESATGKTLLCNFIRKVANNKNKTKDYCATNIIIIDTTNINLMYEIKHKLFIIDNAEITLSKKDIDFIDNNSYYYENRYLVMARDIVGFSISPNHFAEIKDTEPNKKRIIL